MYELRDTPFEFCWNQHFFTGNQQIFLCQQIQVKIAFWYIISIYFNFFDWLYILIINVVKILMMSAKMATSDLLKTKVFWNKGYYVIYSVYEVTSKILSHDPNYIVAVVVKKVWHLYKRSYNNINFIRIWPQKLLFWRVVLVEVQ